MTYSASIEIDTLDTDRMLKALDQAIGAPNLFFFLRDVAVPWLRRRIGDRFAKEGDELTAPWLPLHPLTNDIRESMGFPREHPINRRTGEMEDYLTRGAFDISVGVTQASLSLPGRAGGAKLKNKIRVAQQGNPKNPRVPPRPVLAVGEMDEYFMLGALALWVREEIARFH